MTKRGSLSNFAASKAALSPDPAAESAAPAEKAPTKGMTLRLNEAAWKQLKSLAIDEGRPAHDILIDALNDYFRGKGKSPLA